MENQVTESELLFDDDLGNVFTTEVEGVVESETIEIAAVADEVLVASASDVGEAEAVAVASLQLEADVDIAEETTVPSQEFVISTEGFYAEAEVPELPEMSFEEQLRSHEKLDRSSPDLWPASLPTVAKQILHNNQLKTGDTDHTVNWAHGLDPEDINLLHQFGSLTSQSLVEEVKKLQNIAHQLGLDERKEMTRGKLLHVLDEPQSQGSEWK